MFDKPWRITPSAIIRSYCRRAPYTGAAYFFIFLFFPKMNDEAQNLVLSSLLGLADLRVFSVLLGVSLSGYALQMAFYGTHRQMSLWSIWVVYPAKTCFEASALLSGGLCGLTLASSILWGSWQWSLLSARTFVITTALCVSIPLFFWF